jgi:hypothetical protein
VALFGRWRCSCGGAVRAVALFVWRCSCGGAVRAVALFVRGCGLFHSRRAMWEHMFAMTSDGNAYARFRRALRSGNEALVIAAARELPHVALDDALRICLVLRGGNPARYERAAVRWLGRFALEARNVTISDLRAAADALDALPRSAGEAMERLQRLCVEKGLG